MAAKKKKFVIEFDAQGLPKLESIEKVIKTFPRTVNEANKKLKALKDAIKDVPLDSLEFEEIAKGINQANEQLEEYNDTLKETSKSTKKLVDEQVELEGSIDSLVKIQKELEKELKKVPIGTKAYTDLQSRLRKVNDTLANVSSAQRGLTSTERTQSILSFVRAYAGLSAVIGTLTTSIAGAGNASKELTATFQQFETILKGLEAINEGLFSENSAFNRFFDSAKLSSTDIKKLEKQTKLYEGQAQAREKEAAAVEKRTKAEGGSGGGDAFTIASAVRDRQLRNQLKTNSRIEELRASKKTSTLGKKDGVEFVVEKDDPKIDDQIKNLQSGKATGILNVIKQNLANIFEGIAVVGVGLNLVLANIDSSIAKLEARVNRFAGTFVSEATRAFAQYREFVGEALSSVIDSFTGGGSESGILGYFKNVGTAFSNLINLFSNAKDEFNRVFNQGIKLKTFNDIEEGLNRITGLLNTYIATQRNLIDTQQVSNKTGLTNILDSQLNIYNKQNEALQKQAGLVKDILENVTKGADARLKSGFDSFNRFTTSGVTSILSGFGKEEVEKVEESLKKITSDFEKQNKKLRKEVEEQEEYVKRLRDNLRDLAIKKDSGVTEIGGTNIDTFIGRAAGILEREVSSLELLNKKLSKEQEKLNEDLTELSKKIGATLTKESAEKLQQGIIDGLAAVKANGVLEEFFKGGFLNLNILKDASENITTAGITSDIDTLEAILKDIPKLFDFGFNPQEIQAPVLTFIDNLKEVRDTLNSIESTAFAVTIEEETTRLNNAITKTAEEISDLQKEITTNNTLEKSIELNQKLFLLQQRQINNETELERVSNRKFSVAIEGGKVVKKLTDDILDAEKEITITQENTARTNELNSENIQRLRELKLAYAELITTIGSNQFNNILEQASLRTEAAFFFDTFDVDKAVADNDKKVKEFINKISESFNNRFQLQKSGGVKINLEDFTKNLFDLDNLEQLTVPINLEVVTSQETEINTQLQGFRGAVEGEINNIKESFKVEQKAIITEGFRAIEEAKERGEDTAELIKNLSIQLTNLSLNYKSTLRDVLDTFNDEATKEFDFVTELISLTGEQTVNSAEITIQKLGKLSDKDLQKQLLNNRKLVNARNLATLEERKQRELNSKEAQEDLQVRLGIERKYSLEKIKLLKEAGDITREENSNTKKNLQDLFGALQQLAQEVAGLIDALYQKQIEGLDKIIQDSTNKISKLDELLDKLRADRDSLEEELDESRGAKREQVLNSLETRQERLVKLEAQRFALQQKQIKAEERRNKLEEERANIQRKSLVVTQALAVAQAISAASTAGFTAPAVLAALAASVGLVTAAVTSIRRDGGMIELRDGGDIKLKRGGLVRGASHNAGGVKLLRNGSETGYEVEGGEFVMNRTATKKFRPLLEKINNSVPFDFKDSKLGQMEGNSVLNNKMLGTLQELAERPVFVTVTDIRKGEEKLAKITEKSKR
jgi:predicted  nucleic acid-binding Zn-ribbon protein